MATKKSLSPKKRGYCGIPNNDICAKYHNHAIVRSSPLPWFGSSRSVLDKKGQGVVDAADADIGALIVRRVNAGPAFDALLKASETIEATEVPTDAQWKEFSDAVKSAREAC